MKRFTKFPLAVCALISACSVIQQPAQGVHHIWFDNASFWDSSWIDDMMDFHRRSTDFFKQQMADVGPSKEDREAIKASREKLNKIQHEIKEDDHKITIKFSGFEHLDKQNIKVVKKENGWIGTIKTKEGTVEFFIAANGIQVSRRVELKREETTPVDAKTPAKDEKVNVVQVPAKDAKGNVVQVPARDEKGNSIQTQPAEKREKVFYSSSTSSEGEYFKQLVDISTLKAEPVRDNTLTLTVEKQKEETLHIG